MASFAKSGQKLSYNGPPPYHAKGYRWNHVSILNCPDYYFMSWWWGADAGVGSEWGGRVSLKWKQKYLTIVKLPSVELKTPNCHSMVFERYWSHVEDFQDVIIWSSKICRRASFPKCSKVPVSRFLSFRNRICPKNDLGFALEVFREEKAENNLRLFVAQGSRLWRKAMTHGSWPRE